MVDRRFTLSVKPVGNSHFYLIGATLRGNWKAVAICRAAVDPRLHRSRYARMVAGWGRGGTYRPSWWGPIMRRVMAIIACGCTLAACSSISMSSLNFMKSTPSAEALRIESEPPGAEARASTGQSCRTPCELAVQAGGEVSVTLALNGFQQQTVSVRPEAPQQAERNSEVAAAGARLTPNPIYVELQPALAAPPARKLPAAPKKKKPVTTAARTASTATAAAPAPAAATSPTTEPAASATNYPWPTR